MKKSFLLFSSIAVSMLLILISCTKENASTLSPYVKETAPGFVDTPYGRTFKPVAPFLKTYLDKQTFVDTPYGRTIKQVTPYLKTYPVVQSYVDTPYGRVFKTVTPYLKTYPVEQTFVDTPYGRKHGR